MRFEGSRFIGKKTTSKEKGISNEVVVEVIVDKVPQLAGHMARGKRHGGARGGERDVVVVMRTEGVETISKRHPSASTQDQQYWLKADLRGRRAADLDLEVVRCGSTVECKRKPEAVGGKGKMKSPLRTCLYTLYRVRPPFTFTRPSCKSCSDDVCEESRSDK